MSGGKWLWTGQPGETLRPTTVASVHAGTGAKTAGLGGSCDEHTKLPRVSLVPAKGGQGPRRWAHEVPEKLQELRLQEGGFEGTTDRGPDSAKGRVGAGSWG